MVNQIENGGRGCEGVDMGPHADDGRLPNKTTEMKKQNFLLVVNHCGCCHFFKEWYYHLEALMVMGVS